MTPPRVESPVFLLDYDGTLVPIAPRPELARPPRAVLRLLDRLNRRHPLYIVSGRRARDLEALVGRCGLRVFGVHGMEEGETCGEVRSLVDEKARAALEALRRALPRVPGVRVEDKALAIAFHYRGIPDEAGALEALRAWARELPDSLEVLEGKKVLEVRPRGFGKGRAARRIASRHPQHTPVIIGDDATDEEMFAALPGAVTVKVGPGASRARYRLPDPESVWRYLRQYLEDHEDQHAEADEDVGLKKGDVDL